MNYNTANSSREFLVPKLPCKMLLSCTLLKHTNSVVVASSKKLLVLRCKKAKECQCTWKLCAMVASS